MVHELHRLTFLKMMAQKEEEEQRKREEEQRKREEEAKKKGLKPPPKPTFNAPRMRALDEKQTPPPDPNDPMSNPTVRAMMGAEVQETLEEVLNV